MGPPYRPFRDATDALDDPERLRARMREDGYLFLRGFAPKDKVLRLRREILGLCRQAGWLAPSDDPLDATWGGAGPYAEGDPAYMAVYKQILRLPGFNELPEDGALLRLMAKVLGGLVLCHRLHIGRITFPNHVRQTTGPHQDWHYIRGTPDTYTCWVPLGDCPLRLGGLAVLRGSHRGGFIEHAGGVGPQYAGWGIPDDRLPAGDGVEWHAGDYRLGDMIVFHAHTVHKALPNLTGDQLRLSVDNRYQRQGEVVGAVARGSHYGL